MFSKQIPITILYNVIKQQYKSQSGFWHKAKHYKYKFIGQVNEKINLNWVLKAFKLIMLAKNNLNSLSCKVKIEKRLT